MDDVPFKPRAYEKAAQAIESHDRPLDAVYRAGGVKALREIPGIGSSMAEKLEELITTGKCKLREEYHRRMPVDLAALTALEGAGPKRRSPPSRSCRRWRASSARATPSAA